MMSVLGSLESFRDGYAVGWALETGSQSIVEIEFYLDDELILTGSTGKLRIDTATTYQAPLAGFEIAIPQKAIQTGGILAARAFGIELGKIALKRTTVISEMFAGTVESLVNTTIVGWAVNLESPSTPVVLSVLQGSRAVGSCITSVSLPDLQAQLGAKTTSGFEYQLPPYLWAGTPSLLRFFVANTQIELGGSPFSVGGRPSPDRKTLLDF